MISLQKKEKEDQVEIEKEKEEEVEKAQSISSDYVPGREVPGNLPVYPGAQMWLDSQGYGQGDIWQWFYRTDASANEIIEFYLKELKELGFEISEDDVIAAGAEFYLYTTCETVSLGWADEEKGQEPDTAGRDYGLFIDFEKWDRR